MPNGKSKKNTNGGKRQNGNGKSSSGKSKGRNIGKMSYKNVGQSIQGSQRNIRPIRNKGSVLYGTDFLGRVTVLKDATTVASRILGTFPISPSGYPGTRVSQLSENWERYRFNKLTLRYVPSVPTTVACQFVLYIDTDPSDDPTTISTIDQLIRQAVSQEGAQQWNFSSEASANLCIRKDNQLYYTGLDKLNERFSRAGNAFLIQVTTPVNFNGDAITSDIEAGSLYIDWDCYFETPQINPVASILPPAVGIHQADWSSEGHIDSGVQLFKINREEELTGHETDVYYYCTLAQPLTTQDRTLSIKAAGVAYPICHYNPGDPPPNTIEIADTVGKLNEVYTMMEHEKEWGDFNLQFYSAKPFTITDLIVPKIRSFISPTYASRPASPPMTTSPILPHTFLSAAENLAIRDADFKPNFADKLDTTLDSTDCSVFQLGILNTIKARSTWPVSDPDLLNCGRCCPPKTLTTIDEC